METVCPSETVGLSPGSAALLLGLIFVPEDGSDKFLLNVGLLPNYTALQDGRPYCSVGLRRHSLLTVQRARDDAAARKLPRRDQEVPLKCVMYRSKRLLYSLHWRRSAAEWVKQSALMRHLDTSN
jgi:hypothetical protein